MKSTIWKVMALLLIISGLVLVQNVSAETATGTIESIDARPNRIVVAGTEITGVRFNYLCNQYNICLAAGDVVTVEYYPFECSDGSIVLKACLITVDDVTVALRDCL